MAGDFYNIRLLISIIGAVTVFIFFWAIFYWLVYNKDRQAQVERATLVGQEIQGVTSRRSFLARLADEYDRSDRSEKVRQALSQADFTQIKPSVYIAACIFIGLVIFYLLLIFVQVNFLFALIVAIIVPVLAPRLFLASRRHHYLKSFNKQLVEVAYLLASSLRAGQSLPQAINNVAYKVPPPAGSEFKKVSQELNLGKIPFEKAMQDMLRRVPSEELKIMVMAILIQKQAGGNLVKALSELSNTMAERQRVANEIRTMTAEVRFAVNIIIFLPVVVLVFMRTALPGFIDALFTEPMGYVILVIFAAVQVVAYVIIQRIANIKV